MATEAQRSALRLDTGTVTASLGDTEIDTIYLDAAVLYTNAVAQDAYARVVVFRRLLAQAAPRANYQQNQTREDVGALFDHYKQMVAYWQEELAIAVNLASDNGMMRWGSMRRNPTRSEEYPDA
jgi:hypothetical protein